MKKLNILILSVLMVVFSAFHVKAYGDDLPIVYTGPRSITVTLTSPEGDPVEDCELYLYLIAPAALDGTKFYFDYPSIYDGCPKLTADLIGPGSLDTNYTMALSYWEVISDNGVAEVDVQSTDATGEAVFSVTTDGLYLVVQKLPNIHRYIIRPFVVTMPYQSGTLTQFSVNASPKTQVYKQLPPPPSEIPETGQLIWPIPVLCIAGLLFIVAGSFLNRYEKAH